MGSLMIGRQEAERERERRWAGKVGDEGRAEEGKAGRTACKSERDGLERMMEKAGGRGGARRRKPRRKPRR
jgi:hypothetical protein